MEKKRKRISLFVLESVVILIFLIAAIFILMPQWMEYTEQIKITKDNEKILAIQVIIQNQTVDKSATGTVITWKAGIATINSAFIELTDEIQSFVQESASDSQLDLDAATYRNADEDVVILIQQGGKVIVTGMMDENGVSLNNE